MSGVVMPPSWTHVLCRRKGVLARLEKPGPRQRNVFAEPGGARRLDRYRLPRRLERIGEAFGGPHQRVGAGQFADRDQHPLAPGEGAADRMGIEMF